jgi:tetratricopeptide (TPR) repeat protein
VAGDLDAAEAAFAEAWRLWKEGAGGNSYGVLGEWRLLDLESSLRRDRERFDEAMDLVDRALAAAPPPSAGKILVNKAAILEAGGREEEAVAALRAAEPHVDGGKDPRLRFGMLFNLAVDLCHLGQTDEAADLIPEIRQLNARLGNQLDALRLLWLEGTVAAGRDRADDARAALEKVREQFRRLGHPHEVALVSLELAQLYLAAGGRTAEVREIAREVCPHFCRLRLPRSTAAAVELFAAAAEQEAVTAEMVCRLLGALRRAAR